jgi:hypothetical protein
MTFRFSDFRMGAVAIAALLHDVLVVVGIFAILGTIMGLQIDALFVTAMLTVIGFSVHDTIVVFDRIRENRVRHAGEPFARSSTTACSRRWAARSTRRSRRCWCCSALLLLRQRGDARLHLRDGRRHHRWGLLVDLQRQRAAGRLAPVERPSTGAAGLFAGSGWTRRRTCLIGERRAMACRSVR